MKRCAIFVYFDREGNVDDYVTYLLKHLRPCVSNILAVCNGELKEEGKAKLESVADQVLFQENKGFGIEEYKEGLFYYGFQELLEYDEILLLNHTFFGPLYPFSEMFDIMEKKDIDFWGITKSFQASPDLPDAIQYGYTPEYIEPYFMVFRKRFFKTEDFRSYWENLPDICGYEGTVGYQEAIFIKEFADKGYQWAVYADCPELEQYTFDALRDFPTYLIKEKRCPVIKRCCFFHEYGDTISRSGGEETREAFAFIEKKLDYDTGLIWDNILRLENQADIKKQLHLNYVLSSKLPLKKTVPRLTAALVLHIYYTELTEYCLHYVTSMPEGTDIYITVPTEEKKQYVQTVFEPLKGYHWEIRVTGNSGRDVVPFLRDCKDITGQYDLVCKVHAKKSYHDALMISGESWRHKCFENLLKSRIFVKNVMAVFEDNPYLGLLAPPMPHHGPYYPTCGKGEWGGNFPITKEVARKLGLSVSMIPNKEPIAPLGSMFWARTKALKGLFAYEWNYEEFPEEPIAADETVLHAIERIYPFCVQQEGYYPAWLMADTYARIEFTNWRFINGELHKAAMQRVGISRHKELLEKIRGQR